MRLIWREEARSELRAIVAYIAQRDPAAASDLKERIELCAERLVDHPFMYRRGRVSGTREAVVHPNYVLVYRIAEDAIEILNVLHSRQQYPPAS